MLSFKGFVHDQVLYEKITTRTTALRKVNKLAKMHGDEVPTRERVKNVSWRPMPQQMAKDYESTNLRGKNREARNRIAANVENVPLDKIRTQQSHVTIKGLKDKIKGDKRNDPPVPFFIKSADGYYDQIDGNHRAQARMIRGFKHIRGYVGKDPD